MAFALFDPEYLTFLYLSLGGALVCSLGYLRWTALTKRSPRANALPMIGGIFFGAVVMWAVVGLLLALVADLWTSAMDDTP